MIRCLTLFLAIAIALTATAACWAMTGEFDVGGGQNDFPTIVAAVAALTAQGLTGPVTFNVYPGTYDGQVNITYAITGMGPNNPLSVRGVPGMARPIVTNTTGVGMQDGYGFYLTSVKYVTIEGFEVRLFNYNGIRATRVTGLDSCRFVTIKGNYVHEFTGTGQTTAICLFYGIDCQILNNVTIGGYNGIYNFVCTRSLVANNMAIMATSNVINNYYGSYNQIIHNAAYGEALITFQNNFSPYCTVKNNVFYNGAAGQYQRAIEYNETGTATMISDFNDLYAPGGNVMRWNNTFYATLAAYQAATSQDLHSVSAEPNFVNNQGDLHINGTILPSPLDGAATPIAAVPTDFDGLPRDPVTPDIGCDEFTTTSTQALTVTLTPHNPPIQIPPGGGSFQYDLLVKNSGPMPVSFDAWIKAIMPGGSDYYVIIRPGLGLAAGDSLFRANMNQNVPASAPAGTYHYVAAVGTYPNVAVASDTIDFVKLGVGGGRLGADAWFCAGDPFEMPHVETQSGAAISTGFIISATPNPFNPSTVLSFQLSADSRIKLEVFDISGRQVAVLVDGRRGAGVHEVTFDGLGLAAGVYVYRLKAGEMAASGKMVLVK